MKYATVVKEFSRFAHAYNVHNVIQEEVAKTLVELLPKNNYDVVIDIGCGSGAVYQYMKSKNIRILKFIALDSSLEMLAIHPEQTNIEKVCANFNTQEAFSFAQDKKSLLISSSALQWSKNLDFTFSKLASKASEAYFSIFTSATFQTLHQISGASSPIYSVQTLKSSINKYYEAQYEVQRYTLKFTSVKEMFRYIKRSGVSGGEKQLNYKEAKHLMDTYPLDYLEFEVLFVRAKSLTFFD